MGRSTHQVHWRAYARASAAPCRARARRLGIGARAAYDDARAAHCRSIALAVVAIATVSTAPLLPAVTTTTTTAAARGNAARLPTPRAARRAQHGFTLIELLVAAAVLCVFAAMAVPNFTGFVHNSRMTAEATAFLRDFDIARSEAARRNVSVTVCPTTDGANCIDDWTQRRVVFVEPAGADATIGVTDEVIRNSDAPHARLVVVPNNVPNGGKFVRFRSTGTVENSSPSWALCETGSTAPGRLVSIGNSGRPSVQDNACL